MRSDVKGGDQDAAPAVNGDPGRQLHRCREYRGHSIHRCHSRAFERSRMAKLQGQQKERSLHRSHLRDQGAYCLRVTEEQKIYEKLIQGSELASAPCAPATLETLARFSVMSRLRKHENSTLFAKMRVYDGESLKESDPKARSVEEYKHAADVYQ